MLEPRIKLTLVWVALCVTTLLSVGASGASTTRYLTEIALGIAFFKVLLVMIYFMELPQAAVKYRASYLSWSAIVFLLLILLSRI
ncbi:MAG: cytochrome C oxidase subunit IV family protein [Pseudomonadota bacterium]